MSLLDDWLETFESVLTGPTEFFRAEERRDGFGYPLKFALISLVLAAVFNSVKAGFLGPTQLGQVLPFSGSLLIAFGVLVLSPVVGYIGLLVTAALVHVFAMLLGGEAGFDDTLSVFEYESAVFPVSALASLLPGIGSLLSIVIGIYGFYIQIRGLEEFQDLSTLRAVGAILLPGLILGAIAVIIAALFFSLSLGLTGAA